MTTNLSESLGGGSPAQWAEDFLRAAGFPVTPANVQAIYSWQYAESGGGGGMWNPLNTTESIGAAGETWFNSFGPGGKYHVLNFAQRQDGLAANAKAIHNGNYPLVVGLLQLGNSAEAIVSAVTASPWGTGHIALRPVPDLPSSPAPTEEVVEQLIGSPHKPTTQGRRAAAVWSSGNPNVVLCTNGAKIKGATETAFGWIWRPPITHPHAGIGIFPTVHLTGLSKGEPDGQGIVLQDNSGATFIGEWTN